MKLIKLSSSIDSFKTLDFNPQGFTFILAEKTKDSSDIKDSFNGVGKSLIIYLIHYCLGSKSNPDLQIKLPDEYFILEFKIKDKTYIAKRNTSEQGYINLNEEKLTCKTCVSTINKLIFPDSKTKNLTFKQLISRFIRPFTYSYSAWNKWLPKENKQEHVPNLNTLYLFGIDPEIMSQKFELKKKLKEYKEKLASFKKDPILQEYFNDVNKDLTIDIETLRENIITKQSRLKSLNFSKDYYDIETKTENLAINLRKVNNKIILLRNALSNIDQALQHDFTKNSKFVSTTYEILKSSMKEDALHELKEVLNFHHNLLNNRKKRLKEEKIRIVGEIEKLNQEYIKMTREHNSYLHLLNKNAPFEQGLAIKEEISKLTQKLNRLQQYDEIIQKYDSKISNKKTEFDKANNLAEEYLKEIKDFRLKIDKKFKELIHSFYDGKEAYITIKNNIGNNTTRFNLNVKVEDDSSNGVREVELFCFDLILFYFKKNANINFIFHDSRLFAHIDPTQMIAVFENLMQLMEEKDNQYIVSLNQNQYRNIEEEFKLANKKEVFSKIFNKETIKLKLKETPEDKLLGFQIDLDYDRT